MGGARGGGARPPGFRGLGVEGRAPVMGSLKEARKDLQGIYGIRPQELECFFWFRQKVLQSVEGSCLKNPS